jgi:hypothetical protein
MSKILKAMIKQSYLLPNGHKLRKACLQYGYLHNSFKTAEDFSSWDPLQQTMVDDLSTETTEGISYSLALSEVSTLTEKLEGINQNINNSAKEFKNKVDMIKTPNENLKAITSPKVNDSKTPSINEDYNTNQSYTDNSYTDNSYTDNSYTDNSYNPTQTNQSYSNSYTDNSYTDNSSQYFDQRTYITNIITEAIKENSSKTPFLASLIHYYPWIIGFIVAVIIAYSLKNHKKAVQILKKAFKKIKNLGKILFKVLSISYKWLVKNVFSNLVKYTPTILENGKKLLFGVSDVLIKGLSLGGSLLLKAIKFIGVDVVGKILSALLGVSVKAIDVVKWYKDREEFGEKTANYLQRLRADDREQQKMVSLIKQNLHLSRTARLNLIRVAYQADYRLGQYALCRL